MLALTSCTGKLGSATLNAILEHNLASPSDLVICTSSDINASRWATVKSKGAQVRSFNFDNPDPAAFEGCTKLFLVSTPRISMDFNDAAEGGREKHHIAAIKTAQKGGVKHIYYTSLAFGSNSHAGVMRAHLRTEEFLNGLEKEGMRVTVIREGLYNESWPLYLGYYDLKADEREEVVVAGDGKINWTAIKDLGLGTALVLADLLDKYVGKTFYLASAKNPKTLKQIAGIVSSVKGKEVAVNVVSREEYVRHYVQKGRDEAAVEWWSSTYGALEKGECLIQDPTLDDLLAGRGVKAKPIEETVKEMLHS